LPLISVLSFNHINDEMRNKDIKDIAEKEYSKNRSSVLPADYSVNSSFKPESQWYLEHTGKR
jgi:hypothetical protein